VDSTYEPRKEWPIERAAVAWWAADRGALCETLVPPFLDGSAWRRLAAMLRLSKREAEIAWHIMHDRSVAETAERIGISGHTVQTHRERLYRKLRVRSRCQLVVRLFGAYVWLVESDGRRATTVSRATDAVRADL
jgi:DNA-binding CsgD family transcriptional regulator